MIQNVTVCVALRGLGILHVCLAATLHEGCDSKPKRVLQWGGVGSVSQGAVLWAGSGETAAALAVIHFNNGSGALLKVLTEMGCSLGEFTHRQLLSEDRMRVQKSNKETESEKRSRKRRRRRKGLEDQQKDVEGVTYAAGGFH